MSRNPPAWLSRRGAALTLAICLGAVLLTGGLLLLLGGGPAGGRTAGALLVVAGWMAVAATAVALPATGYRSLARSLRGRESTLRSEVAARGDASVTATKDAQKAIQDSVGAARSALTAEQQRQRRTLARIETSLKALSVTVPPALPAGRTGGIDVLFVTSNGAGLGHLSRLMAIAKQLPETRTVEFLTLSTAYRQAAGAGFTVHYFPSAEASGRLAAEWNAALRDHVRELIVASRPSVVVFDGTWVYSGLTEVCRALRVPLVWVQRGMWKPEADARSRQRHHAAEVAQSVIVPGEFALQEHVDAGDGVEVHHVDPIVMTAASDVLERDEACARLGLDPERRYVLVNLGGGLLADPTTGTPALRLLRELAPDIVPVQVISPLGAYSEPDPGVVRVVAYPVMPCIRAFEFMISAAGYNSAAEAVALGVPSVLVPNPRAKTDDQVRRARLLADQGLVLCATDEADLASAIQGLAEESRRIEMVEVLRKVPAPSGASQAAQVLDDAISRARWTDPATTVHSRQMGGIE